MTEKTNKKSNERLKIAIVTGASSGRGKRFALYSHMFFPDIDEVWLVGRNEQRLLNTSKFVRSNTRIFALDLTDEDELKGLTDSLKDVDPDIRLLINSAGCGYMGRFDVISTEDNIQMVDINCRALTMLTSICVNYMHKDSRIINLASAAAFICQSNFAVYAATKSYVLSLSDALSKELRRKKIYVTAVCPGAVNTPFFDTADKYEKIKKFKKLFMSKEKYVVIKALWDSKKKKNRSVYGLHMKMFYLACKLLPRKLMMMFV